MAISQVALSNTFNEFRSTFNDAANTVNTLVPSANAISANTLSLGGTTDASSTTTGTLIVAGGVGVAKKLYVGTDLSVAGDATFTGNVTILGSNSEISTTQINVNDPLIQLANNNTSNTVDIGLFGQYNPGSANLHSGLFRDASDGIWKFFKDYNIEPGTTIDPAANGFSYANVNIGALSAANNISIGTGQAYQINGANVLSSTVLGSTVLASSLTSVGALASGSITSAFGSIDIGTDTLAAGNTTITGTLSTTGAITAPQAGNIIPFYYANTSVFPSAATYHGAMAHSHANGAMYYAHASNWVQLADSSTSVSTGKSIAMAMIFGF